ncbi:MAG: hypothetical protein K6E16_09375 [Lachnospiraceae bacterium]|nr:hypothetical protein [Lachnospiraceae bacterium]
MKLEILSARMMPKETEPPVIREPPGRSEMEQASLLLTIAPSFTMALPMLLGFYLMYRGNRGMGTSYMSMGLTTAIGSAVLGTIWASINYNRRRAKMRFAERLRKRTYRAYLKECEKMIGEQVNYLENLMRNRDPVFEDWIDVARQRVSCAREIPWGNAGSGAREIPCGIAGNGARDGTGGKPAPAEACAIRLRIGIGSQYYPIRLDASTSNFGKHDVLREEARALIARHEMLKRIPVYLTCRKGMSVEVIADKISDLISLFRMLAVRAMLTWHERFVKLAFCFDDPLFLHELEALDFAPHVIANDDPAIIADLPEQAVILVFAKSDDHIPAHLQGCANTVVIRLGLKDTQQAGVRLLCTGVFQGLIPENGEHLAVRFDTIGEDMAELTARALCRLRNDKSQDNAIPDVYPILHMIRGEPEHIADHWKHTDVLHSLKVPLGISHDGKITYLDAHDKRDGPHGLIAGMTGSGKSELLMTYILSLAAKYPPWEVAFFLIDYKGGGMSAAFRGLPHVIGSISNLSGHTIHRAFLSIRSENERRQRLFLQANVNHISDYHKKFYEGICSEALPHLFLIIDEFAQLKNEEPEFMQELIGLSRVGRSLGIHLLLCTQKPSGSVDSTIMTNARFQIALRLQDPMDSKEILHHPDAAYLKNPGRAILRIGNDEVYETFQAAYALSPAVEQEKRHVLAADAYGRLLHEGDAPAKSMHSGNGQSSMEKLLSSISTTAERLRTEKSYPYFVSNLWLEELPEVLHVSELKARILSRVTAGTDDGMPKNGMLTDMVKVSKNAVPIGIWDDPVIVKQGVLFLDHTEGNHLICGMPRSGKSTLLCTYIRGLLEVQKEAKVYAFDFGGGAIKELAERCTQIRCIAEKETERIVPALTELKDENDAVVVIDGLGVMTQAGGFGVTELLTELFRNGARRKLRAFISANSVGMGEMSQIMHTYMDRSLCLRMPDAFRYAEVLKDPKFKGSTDLPPGRGYVKAGERIVEFMAAVPP